MLDTKQVVKKGYCFVKETQQQKHKQTSQWWKVDPQLTEEINDDSFLASISNEELVALVKDARRGDTQQKLIEAHYNVCIALALNPTLENLYLAVESTLSIEEFADILYTQLRCGNVVELNGGYIPFHRI